MSSFTGWFGEDGISSAAYRVLPNASEPSERMWVRSGVVACLVLWSSGCARPYDEATDDAEVTSNKRTSQDAGPKPAVTTSADAGRQPVAETDAGTVAPVANPTPTPTDVVWAGSLAKVGPVAFGGSPYCAYAVTFTNLRVSIVVNRSSQIKSAEVKAVVTETSVDCTGVIPVHEQTYLYATTQPTEATVVTLAAMSTNKPRAEGTLTTSTEEGGLRAKLRLHRIDQVDALNWTLETTVDLSPLPN
jgi:hypothetical protein